MSENKYNLTVKFEGLTGGQILALRLFFEMMEANGQAGHSEWMSFYADGDGNFRPKITTSVEGGFTDIDRHLPSILYLMDNDGRDRIINNSHATFIDPDLYEWYYDEPSNVRVTDFLERHKYDQQVQQILKS